jgi:hypothetical protein
MAESLTSQTNPPHPSSMACLKGKMPRFHTKGMGNGVVLKENEVIGNL